MSEKVEALSYRSEDCRFKSQNYQPASWILELALNLQLACMLPQAHVLHYVLFYTM